MGFSLRLLVSFLVLIGLVVITGTHLAGGGWRLSELLNDLTKAQRASQNLQDAHVQLRERVGLKNRIFREVLQARLSLREAARQLLEEEGAQPRGELDPFPVSPRDSEETVCCQIVCWARWHAEADTPAGILARERLERELQEYQRQRSAVDGPG